MNIYDYLLTASVWLFTGLAITILYAKTHKGHFFKSFIEVNIAIAIAVITVFWFTWLIEESSIGWYL